MILLFNRYLDQLPNESFHILSSEKSYNQLTKYVLVKTVLYNRKRNEDKQYLTIENDRKDYILIIINESSVPFHRRHLLITEKYFKNSNRIRKSHL